MFGQVLPRLAEATEEPPAVAHSPTIRSSYVPSPAEPMASVPVTAPEDTKAPEASKAEEEPEAAGQPAADEEEQAAEAAQAPAAEESIDEAEAAANADAAVAEAAEAAEAGAEGTDGDEAEAEPGDAAEAEDGAELEPAAATAAFKSEPATAPVPVLEAASADGAEPKAAAMVLEAPAIADEEPAAETVIPGKGPARNQPTQVSIPVARVTPSAPAQPAVKAAESTAAPPRPGPTFTAAKPTERATPKFSAGSPARQSPRPSYGPNGTGQAGTGQAGTAHGYAPPQQPFPASGAHYGPPAGNYPGPSEQLYPNGAGQYKAGTGGRAGRRGGPGGRILWLLLAVIVAAAIGVGMALALNHDPGRANAAGTTKTGLAPTSVPSVADTVTSFKSINALNTPSTALPGAGWTTRTVTAAGANSAAAGFSVDVPPGWTETRKGLATDFTGPGNRLLEVDLTQQPTTDMLSAAKQVRAATHFRDYKQLNLQAEPVRHAEGAVWKFDWTPAGRVQYTVDDIFFAQQTSAGVQDYAIYLRSPATTFSGSSLPLFDKILPTFQTVPAT
jgi:hypothetical protein